MMLKNSSDPSSLALSICSEWRGFFYVAPPDDQMLLCFFKWAMMVTELKNDPPPQLDAYPGIPSVILCAPPQSRGRLGPLTPLGGFWVWWDFSDPSRWLLGVMRFLWPRSSLSLLPKPFQLLKYALMSFINFHVLLLLIFRKFWILSSVSFFFLACLLGCMGLCFPPQK